MVWNVRSCGSSLHGFTDHPVAVTPRSSVARAWLSVVAVALCGCGRIGFGISDVDASTNIGLVAWFKFDETGGTTAVDASGNGNDLTLRGGASFAPGRIGNALSLNGVDGAAEAAPTAGLNLTGSMTIAAFLEPTMLLGYNTVVAKGINGTRGYGMNVLDGQLNYVEVGFEDVTSAIAPSVDTFQHVAITWDPTTSAVEFFVNGASTQTIANTASVGAAVDGDPLVVGVWLTGDASYFAGLIDDLRIYDRILAPSELAVLAAQ